MVSYFCYLREMEWLFFTFFQSDCWRETRRSTVFVILCHLYRSVSRQSQNSQCGLIYRVGQKGNRFIRNKSTVILHVHQLRKDSILYKAVCNFALLLVLNILWFSVADTRIIECVGRCKMQSIQSTVIDVTLYIIHRIFYRQNI